VVRHFSQFFGASSGKTTLAMQKKNLCKENGKEIRFGIGQMLHAGES